MSENEQRPENPYGGQPPTNPYGQPLPSSPDETPYGQSPQHQAPYGQAPYGQSPQHQAPYGQDPYGQTPHDQAPQHHAPYGQAPYGSSPYASPYGGGAPSRSGQRPGTVTAAAWTTIVLGALGTLLYLFLALMFVLAQDVIITEIEDDPSFQDLGVSGGSLVSMVVAGILVFAVWSAINLALGIFVLRRSNVARILLVISCALTAVLSLVSIASGVTAVSLLLAVAVIVLLFVGGAGDWFARRDQQTYGQAYQGPR
jgi:uncharacterized membrane protein HdeD (DUF308 family)